MPTKTQYFEVGFKGQYGNEGRIEVCSRDPHGVWRTARGNYMMAPDPTDIGYEQEGPSEPATPYPPPTPNTQGCGDAGMADRKDSTLRIAALMVSCSVLGTILGVFGALYIIGFIDGYLQAVAV